MPEKRRAYSATDKAKIVSMHLKDKKPVSDIAESRKSRKSRKQKRDRQFTQKGPGNLLTPNKGRATNRFSNKGQAIYLTRPPQPLSLRRSRLVLLSDKVLPCPDWPVVKFWIRARSRSSTVFNAVCGGLFCVDATT